jgi:hypothetical protein
MKHRAQQVRARGQQVRPDEPRHDLAGGTVPLVSPSRDYDSRCFKRMVMKGPPAAARAVAVVVGSAAVGGAYKAYLGSVPFPPDFVRAVPLIWLAGSIGGSMLVVQALRLDTSRLAPLV